MTLLTPEMQAEALYTAVFGRATRYGDYLQPDYEEGSHLTPIEWVFTITSVGLGTYLVEFLKELGKRSAQGVVAWLAEARKRREGPDPQAAAYYNAKEDRFTFRFDIAARQELAGKDANRLVIDLLMNEVFPTCQFVDPEVRRAALSSSFRKAEIALVELGLPDDDADELVAVIAVEVSRALEQYLEARSRGDHSDPSFD
jgi:hypothetical protein